MVTLVGVTANVVTGVSGGGVASADPWVKMFSITNGGGQGIDLWVGRIATLGATTITTTTTINPDFLGSTVIGKPYKSDARIDTLWVVDGSGTAQTNTSATSVPFPSKTPGRENEMYLGAVSAGQPISAPSAGYTLDKASASNQGLVFNPSCAVSAQSPTVTASPAGSSYSGGVLLSAESRRRQQSAGRAALVRASHW